MVHLDIVLWADPLKLRSNYSEAGPNLRKSKRHLPPVVGQLCPSSFFKLELCLSNRGLPQILPKVSGPTCGLAKDWACLRSFLGWPFLSPLATWARFPWAKSQWAGFNFGQEFLDNRTNHGMLLQPINCPSNNNSRDSAEPHA